MKMMNRIVRYFFQGLLLISPLAVTVYALVVMFQFIDGLLLQDIKRLVGFPIPGLGMIIILISVTLIGMAGSSILVRPLLIYVDRLVSQAPLVKIIYTSIKEFMSAFVGKDKKFTEPVMIRVSHEPEMDKLGFITQHDLSALGLEKGKVAVYMPYSYGMMGSLYIVDAKNVTALNANSTELMKFIVTGGVTSIPGGKTTTDVNADELHTSE